jgi:hypothetical protein
MVDCRQLFQNVPATQIWFDSDAIIDRRSNQLFAAKVSLRRLNRRALCGALPFSHIDLLDPNSPIQSFLLPAARRASYD